MKQSSSSKRRKTKPKVSVKRQYKEEREIFQQPGQRWDSRFWQVPSKDDYRLKVQRPVRKFAVGDLRINGQGDFKQHNTLVPFDVAAEVLGVDQTFLLAWLNRYLLQRHGKNSVQLGGTRKNPTRSQNRSIEIGDRASERILTLWPEKHKKGSQSKRP